MWVWATEVRTRERNSLIPPGYTRECRSVSFLLLHPSTAPQLPEQQLFQQLLGQQRVLMQNACLKGWGLPGQAQATLRISHEVWAESVLGKVFGSPESKLTVSRSLLPALDPEAPMHNLSLEFTPRHSALVFKKASLIFLYSVSAWHFVRIAHCGVI